MSMKNNPKISVHIKEMRDKRGLTMYKIAQLLGKKTQTHLSQVELGKRTPSVELALEIADVLKCSVDDIYKLIK